MAYIVVNGSAFTGTPGRETLPEMAQSLSGTLGEFQAALARIWSSLPGSVRRHTRLHCAATSKCSTWQRERVLYVQVSEMSGRRCPYFCAAALRYTATLSLIASLGACTRSCFVPRYRSVVCTEAWPSNS